MSEMVNDTSLFSCLMSTNRRVFLCNDVTMQCTCESYNIYLQNDIEILKLNLRTLSERGLFNNSIIHTGIGISECALFNSPQLYEQ